MLSNYLCLVSLTWYDTWLYQTSNKTLVLSVTLPTVRTHCARRDAPFGSVLFLSAIPILPPAVGFPASYPPLCLLLIKHAPVGRGGREGWEEDGRVPSCMSEMLHPSMFLPGVWNMPLQWGSSCTAAPSSLCHALPPICTVCSSCLGHDTSEMARVFHKSVSDRKSRIGVTAPVL